MPVRQIKYSYRNVTGRRPKGKGIGDAQFESSLEGDYLALLEFSPLVESFEVQPVRIWYELEGESRSYTPDVLVKFHPREGDDMRSRQLVEVKYRQDLKENWSWYRQKLKAAIRFAKIEGYRFKVMTEKEIRTPYLTNARFLLPFRDMPIEDCHFGEVMDRMRRLRETDPETLLASIYLDPWNRAKVLPVVWQCVAQGYIVADLTQPLTMRSRIWLAS